MVKFLEVLFLMFFFFLAGCMVAFLTGCAHRVEYYEDGQVKLEETGVLLSDGKSFSIISVK